MAFSNSIKNYYDTIKNYGLQADASDASDYTFTTTTGNTGALTDKQIKDAYKAMQKQQTGTYVTSSTVSSGFSGSWDNWTKEEKKALAKVGFRYDKEKNEWVLDLTATIRIPQLDGFAAMSSGGPDGKPTDQMINTMKQVKEELIEKLTAKIILAELVRPREIKNES